MWIGAAKTGNVPENEIGQLERAIFKMAAMIFKMAVALFEDCVYFKMSITLCYKIDSQFNTINLIVKQNRQKYLF